MAVLTSPPRRVSKARHAWAPRVFAAVAAGLAPWVAVLGATLPPASVARNWPAAWIGLDLMMATGCAATAWLHRRGDPRATLTAAGVAALAVMDAWFDILTAQPGPDLRQALVCAVPELALATFATWFANTSQKISGDDVENP